MGDTSIEWTDRTWNPIRGCSRISPGCGGAKGEGGCYAERQAARFCGPGQPYEGLVRIGKQGPRWTGVVRPVAKHLEDPLRWRRPSMVFVNSMSDLFHESLAEHDIANVFSVMENARERGHRFQVLTKRAARMRRWVTDLADWIKYSTSPSGYLDRYGHVWLGVSVENRAMALERIPELQQTPAVVRFLSVEPQLEDVGVLPLDGISWVIVGGESGPGSRPFDLAWARNIVIQCKAEGVACFVKQIGANPFDSAGPIFGGTRITDVSTVHRKGGDMAEWPPELRVREFPTTK